MEKISDFAVLISEIRFTAPHLLCGKNIFHFVLWWKK